MTRSLVRTFIAGLALAIAAGCVNHKKSADAAAAAGNWKAAEAHYREASRKKPEDAELKRKHAEAKVKAFEQAMATGRTCMDARDWGCATGEFDYATGLEPGNADAKAMAASARKAYAMDDLTKARGAIAGGNPGWGLDMVDHARSLSNDAEVMQQSQIVTGELVTAILKQAGELRSQAQAAGPGALPLYDRAIALLERGAKADMKAGQMLAEVRGEKSRWIDVEYERLCKLGDEGLFKGQWAVAQAQYASAEAMRPNGRGKGAGIYAKLLLDGDAASASRSWAAATDHYRKAAAMIEDNLTRKYAAAQIERVEVRPYRFRLTGVLVNPVRPNGQPWNEPVGGNSAGTSTSRSVPPPDMKGKRGPEARSAAKGYGGRVPVTIRPTVVAEVTLPDGRTLRTEERKEAWAAFDSWFVLHSNQLDQRPISIRVKHVQKGSPKGPPDSEVDLGTVTVSLGALLAGATPEPSGSVLFTEIEADNPRTLADGAFGGFARVVPGRANEATDGSSPSSTAAIGWRLARVDAGVRGTDKLPTGAPDLKVEIEQSGRLVFRSPLIKDSEDGSWAPESVYLFAATNEQLIVRLYDADGNRVVYGGAAAAPQDRTTTVEVKTAQGSFARLVFERRNSTP